jgi:hypothetical protein
MRFFSLPLLSGIFMVRPVFPFPLYRRGATEAQCHHFCCRWLAPRVGERAGHADLPVKQVDGSDAKLIVAANGGSDLIYVPSKGVDVVRATIEILTQLDYVGGIFVDDKFCPAPADCPGALPLSAVGLVGHSPVRRPAIVVTYKVFYQTSGDLQSAAQVSDTTLQEGQGMHGGFGRDQTFNNMAAMGPDFKTGFVGSSPLGNIDIAPTLAHILGLEMPSAGSLKGRILEEHCR